MNNKGFTLVEVIVTVVILSAIMGIATYNVFGAINKSKEKSEEIFVSKFETIIQSYITDNRFNWRTGDSVGNFIKCKRIKDDGTCLSAEETETKDFYNVEGNSITDSMFNLSELANEKYIQGGEIINPKNKFNCLDNGKNPKVLLYKDDDSVFYYYVDLGGANTSCDIDNKNAIVSNIPKNMCNSLSSFGFSWNSTKEVCNK